MGIPLFNRMETYIWMEICESLDGREGNQNIGQTGNTKLSLLYEKTFLSLQDWSYSLLLGLSPSSVSVEKYVFGIWEAGLRSFLKEMIELSI